MKTIRYFKVDKLQGYVFANREEMGEFAASDIANMMKAMLATKGTINVMFAAAPSQDDMLKALVADTSIDWTRVNAFHMDEYIGLTAEAPQGFGNFLRNAIFDKKPFASVNFIDATADDAQQEALRYEQVLKEHPLDICLLGVGENGHIAFNDPPVADFQDDRLVKVVELERKCRMQQVNDDCFNSIDEVPTHGITVTIPALLSASAMFCVVPNERKAKAIADMLYDSVSTSCPASILRTHESARLYLDNDAVSMLNTLGSKKVISMKLKRKIYDAKNNEDGLIFFPEECETIAVNAVFIKKGQVSQLAVHDDEEEIYLITQGKGIVEIDGIPHEAEVGDVFYIPRNATHFVQGTSEEEFIYVCVAVWPDRIPEKNK